MKKFLIVLFILGALCDMNITVAQSCGSTTANQALANHCDLTVQRMINFTPSMSVTVNQLFRDAILTSLTTTGSGAATWNSATGVMNIPTPSVSGSAGGDLTGTYPNPTLANIVTAGTGGIVTIDAKGRVTAYKRQETFRGTTNGSGVYTVTYSNAYSQTPTVVPSFITNDPRDVAMVTASSTTGFSILIQRRVDVIGLLPSYTNRSGVTVDVNVNEQ